MIGFLDSGIGGLSVLAASKKQLPRESFLYLCDTKNLPYGGKSAQELQKITLTNVKALKKAGCRVVCLACNTATACAISYVRAKMPEMIFVGTEPNVKGPIQAGCKKILVLCTRATAEHSRVLIESKERGEIEIFCPDALASLVEKSFFDGNAKQYLPIAQLFSSLQADSYDAVVIGCTHYCFAEKELQKIFVNARFFDSSEGAAKRLKQIVNSRTNIVSKSKSTQA